MADPFRPDDELVSAVLDGEATADERARVEGDPALRARLAELQAARELVAAPVPPPDDLARERAIRAALAEHRRSAPPARGAPRRPRTSRWLAAAAVVAVLLGGGVLLSRMDPGEDLAGDDSGGDESAEVTSAAEGGDGDSAEAPAGEVMEDALGALDLGAVDDATALRSAVAAAYSAARANDAAASEGSDDDDGQARDSRSCQVALEEQDPTLGGVLLEATATYAGTPALVFLYATDDGGRRVVAVDQSSCAVLATVPF